MDGFDCAEFPVYGAYCKWNSPEAGSCRFALREGVIISHGGSQVLNSYLPDKKSRFMEDGRS